MRRGAATSRRVVAISVASAAGAPWRDRSILRLGVCLGGLPPWQGRLCTTTSPSAGCPSPRPPRNSGSPATPPAGASAKASSPASNDPPAGLHLVGLHRRCCPRGAAAYATRPAGTRRARRPGRPTAIRPVAKAEAAAMWQARAEFLAGQLEQVQLALQAPARNASQERPFLRDSEGLSIEPTQTPSKTPPRAPWWMPWRRVTS